MAKDIAASVRQTSTEPEVITEDADYQGLRVTFTAFLDNARIPMQLDIGFGDAVVTFLAPVMEREVAGPSQEVWVPPGPWVERSM